MCCAGFPWAFGLPSTAAAQGNQPMISEPRAVTLVPGSPVDVYDKNGNGYIIQGDSAGYLHLVNGKNGKLESEVLLNGNIESSPAVFNDVLVVATRNGTIYGVKIK